jgi:hypothetical protein
MMILTDGKKVVELNKHEMETIEEALTDLRNGYSFNQTIADYIDLLRAKLEGFDY